MVSPGELARVPFLVEEGQGGDVEDTFVAGFSRGGVDGTEDAILR